VDSTGKAKSTGVVLGLKIAKYLYRKFSSIRTNSEKSYEGLIIKIQLSTQQFVLLIWVTLEVSILKGPSSGVSSNILLITEFELESTIFILTYTGHKAATLMFKKYMVVCYLVE
jgi:hypothetical protein